MSHADKGVKAKDIRHAIKDILDGGADLNQLSSKKVRKMLEERFKMDLTSRKQEVDDILMALINAEDAEKQNTSEQEEQIDDSDRTDDETTEKERPKKRPNVSNKASKPKKAKSSSGATANGKERGSDSSSDEADDEALARKLQQEELGVRPRTSKKVEKKPKKTASASTEQAPKRKGNSLYSRECVLSEELASVMGTDKMARKDVVSRMWRIFKERNLMDPSNKQYVICDPQLEQVFKTKKFKAFGMMKILKNHIKDAKLVT